MSRSILKVLSYLPISIELILVIVLAAVWKEEIQNVALSAVVATALPALIGVGLGVILVKSSRTYKQKLLDDLHELENHPYLNAIQEEFGEPKYSLGLKNYTAKELTVLHNNLPDRLKLRSRVLHPLVVEEMEDWEHSGLEQMAIVPTPEPWIEYQEKIVISTMVDQLYGGAFRGLNLSFPEVINHMGKIERSILQNLRDLNPLPWPQLVIDEEQETVRYSANGSITGNREAR